MMTNRSLAIGVGGLITAGMIGWGGISAVSLTSGVEREALHQDWVAGKSLSVDTSSGDITFSRSSDQRIYLTGTKQGVLAMPDIEFDRNGSAVTIETNCPVFGWWAECKASFDIAVPDGVEITAITRSGDVNIRDVESPELKLNSTSGDVHVSQLDVSGTLSAGATSGDVTAEDVSADQLELGTTSGDVETARLSASTSARIKVTSGDVNADFTDPPKEMQATATSGDVDVTVPRVEEGYDATADATSGEENQGVEFDPDSPWSIDAHATSGDVSISYR